jgi:putative hydrolase of the HAD superfamily
MMSWKATVFDLFGTLVMPFRKTEHTAAVHGCARILGVDPEACHQAWVDSFPDRVRGRFGSVAENFGWILERLEARPHPQACAEAARSYLGFTRDSLKPLPGVVDALEQIKRAGYRIGLLTNCAPDVPEAFRESELHPFFDAAVFSSVSGCVKPEPRSYQLIAAELGAEPADVLYVGDGSDRELTGAEQAGMAPVLVTPLLDNTYDTARADVAEWTGRRFGTVPDVLSLLQAAR